MIILLKILMSICYNVQMDMTEYKNELAKNIRIERARLNISQTKLAMMSDVSLDTISQIERGIANPTLETIILIANALNVDLNKLIP